MQATKIAAKEAGREMVHILVVDDEKSICELLEITFRKEGHRVEIANSVEAARRKLEGSLYDMIISDVRMPGETGVELLRYAREVAPDAYFVLITGVPTLETAIAAANEGANRYVIKDHDLVAQLRVAVHEVAEKLKWKNEAGYLRRELRRLTGLDNIIGQSPNMRAIFDLIQPRADYRGERHGQGTGGAGHSREQREVTCSVHHHQLRSVPGDAAGVGTIRLHQGRVYGRQRKPARIVPGGARRNAVPG
jgi:DNA-binding NtrC family response regulator